MDRLALIGVSHRKGGAKALEAWQSHFKETTPAALQQKGFAEVVAIQTCNRCDLVVSLPETMDITEARAQIAPPEWPRCYAYIGEGAVEQLTRIASSLDSLNPGEYQVMTQVREAFAQAESDQTVGKQTRFAFTTAFRIAKRIRSEIELAPLNTSLFSLARPLMEDALPKQATIGIIGTGEMGQLAATVLQERPHTQLLLINRTQTNAERLRDTLTCPAKVIGLETFLAQPPAIDALVCATPIRQLVDRAVLQHLTSHTKIIVDLGIPRNVDREAANQLGIDVLDIDTLQQAGQERRERIEASLADAEDLLLDALDDAIGEWIEKQLGSSIRKLREHYIDTIAHCSEQLDQSEQNRLASRMAHIPIKGLRGLAREYGLQAAKAFLKAANL
jgi:glutamyl-tRNA reductase